MKLMVIYRVKEASGEVLSKPLLYAFTDDSSLMELFKETRDMSFFGIKELNVSKEELFEFSKVHGNYRLVIGKFISKDDNEDDTIKRKVINIVVPELEELQVYNYHDRVFTDILPRHAIDIYVFGKKYAKVFDMLDIHRMHFWRIHKTVILNSCYGLEPFHVEPVSFYDTEDMTVDTFSIYMDFFGYMMKKDAKD